MYYMIYNISLYISYLAGVLVLLAVIPGERRVPAPIGLPKAVAAHVVQAEPYTIHRSDYHSYQKRK
jgi:hypothetical protein